MSTPFWQFPFFIYLYFVCSVFLDMCRSKICCYWKMNSSLWYWKMLFTLWQCRSLFDWLSLSVSQTQLPIRGILQISWFYKTKKVLIKQLQRNFFLSKIEDSEGFFKWCSPIFEPPKRLQLSKPYSEPCQTSKTEHFAKKINGCQIPTFCKVFVVPERWWKM